MSLGTEPDGQMRDSPVVSVVVPTLDEADYLDACLRSVAAQDVPVPIETIVVDGGSTDGTVDVARTHDVRVREQSGTGIGPARDEGETVAKGRWLAFVDADTALAPSFLRKLLAFCRDRDLAGASARCRVVGPRRGWAMQVVVNHVFPRLDRPILPGFATVVHRDAYDAVGGYPAVPNEGTAFSRRLGASFDTGYHPDVLVETSGRRFGKAGLTGALSHYLRLDWHRLRTDY